MRSRICLFLLAQLFCIMAFPQSDQVIDSLRNEIRTAKNDSLKSDAMARLGFYFHDLNFDSSFYYSNQSLALAERINYQLGKGHSYYALSHYYWISGLYREALDLALKAQLIFETSVERNRKSIADNYLLIGNIYSYLPDHDKAIQAYRKSLLIAEDLTDAMLVTRSLNNLGYVYVQLKEYDSAFSILDKSLKINRRENNLRGIAYNLSNLAEILIKQNKLDNAITLINESNTTAAQVKDYRLIARNYRELSKIHRSKGSTALALSLAKKSFNTAEDIDAVSEKKEAALLLYEIMEGRGDTEIALKYYKIYMHIEDSLLREKLTSETNLLVKNYELLQKEAELKILRNTDELNRAQLAIDFQKLKSQKNIILLAGLLLLLFLILIYSIYGRYKSKKEYAELLELKNHKIAAQNEEIKCQSEELKSLNEKLSEMNTILEMRVKVRTQQLEEQNKQLEEYAFINSHKLRGPLSSILGLVYLFENQMVTSIEYSDTLEKLKKASIDLDCVIRNINKVLDQQK
jgi:tetratricopeptide (TPR) repeat protein